MKFQSKTFEELVNELLTYCRLNSIDAYLLTLENGDLVGRSLPPKNPDVKSMFDVLDKIIEK
jgi:hypothetical protein